MDASTKFVAESGGKTPEKTPEKNQEKTPEKNRKKSGKKVATFEARKS